MTLTTSQAFDPQYAYFQETQDTRLLYPNFVNRDQIAHYRFFGMLTGKALYEGILLKTTFVSSFLNRLSGRVNHLDDLKTIDPELYKSLMYLKYYEGDARELGLHFYVEEDALGAAVGIPLVPNGE